MPTPCPTVPNPAQALALPDRAALPAGPVLLTGAAGRLARVLVPALSAMGWRLRLTDRNDMQDGLPPGASFTRADLADEEAMADLARGCAAIVHFAGIPNEASVEALLQANVRGTQTVFDAALANGCRVVFASSNHVVGFYRRSQRIDVSAEFRPDSLYGVSKAYGELLARLYWDKYGLPSVSLRIGSCLARPRRIRDLATWLSHGDLARLVARAVLAPSVGCAVIWGISANSRAWWSGDDRAGIGWEPQDSADAFADAALELEVPDPVAEQYQGGNLCSRGRARAGTSFRPPVSGAG